MFDLNQIDKFLNRLDNAKTDKELRAIFSTFQVNYDLSIPADPFGIQYREHQFDIYRTLAGRTYSPSNEKSEFDVAAAAVSPFPYLHRSCELVGDHLMAIGYLIKSLKLSPGARILEFGPGWGNTTIALAKMGFEVTAVDIEQNFIDLIRRRSAMEGLNVKAVLGDFSFIESVTEPYDAVLFFECFHHASDHLAVMSAFEKSVKAGGIVCFAAEPITPDFPIPWGLRMDGESLWAIRKNGWLELGFNDKYFGSALERFGWRGASSRGQDSPASSVIIAKRKADWGGVFRYSTGGLLSQIGNPTDGGCLADGREGYLAYGPYLNLPGGAYRAEVLLNSAEVFFGELLVDVVVNHGAMCLNELKIESATWPKERPLAIEFKSDFQLHNLEVRVRCSEGTRVCLEAIKVYGI
jgi:ubiquinone/menaquinone biosynthesis C-methylase UbiE